MAHTDYHGRDLCNLAHVVIGLHNALYAGDGEVVLDGDVVGVGDLGGRRAQAIARVCHEGKGRVGDVFCIVHAFLVARAARHIGRWQRQRRGRRLGGEGRARGRGCRGKQRRDVGDGASITRMLRMVGLGGVAGRQIWRLWSPVVHDWPRARQQQTNTVPAQAGTTKVRQGASGWWWWL